MTAAAKKADPPEPNGAEVKPAVMTAQAAKQYETLKRDTTKRMLDFFRQQPKPWEKMNEKEQQATIDRFDHEAGTLVNEACTIMASRGFPHFAVQIGKITIDKGIKADMTLPSDPHVLDALIAGKGQTMMLVARNEQQFHAQGRKPAPDVVGDLAIPKSGKGAPSDEKAIAKVGRGKDKDEKHDPDTGELPRTESLTNPNALPSAKEVKRAADAAEARTQG